ncbi:MAG: hypothetical protein ACXWL5_03290 [Candidatus Chromulinivorax sp.]
MKYIFAFIFLCIEVVTISRAADFEDKVLCKRSFSKSTKPTMQDHRKKFSTIGYMLYPYYNVILTRIEPLDATKLGIQDKEIADVVVHLSQKRVETSGSNFAIISKNSLKIEQDLMHFISDLNKKQSFLDKIDKEPFAQQIIDFIAHESGACIADTKNAYNQGGRELITDKTRSRLLINTLEQLLQDIVCKENLKQEKIVDRYNRSKLQMESDFDLLDESTKIWAEKSFKAIENVLSSTKAKKSFNFFDEPKIEESKEECFIN